MLRLKNITDMLYLLVLLFVVLTVVPGNGRAVAGEEAKQRKNEGKPGPERIKAKEGQRQNRDQTKQKPLRSPNGAPMSAIPRQQQRRQTEELSPVKEKPFTRSDYPSVLPRGNRQPSDSGIIKFSYSDDQPAEKAVNKPSSARSKRFIQDGAKGSAQNRRVYSIPAGYEHSAGKTFVLSPEHAESVIRQVNGARSGLGGINTRPLPQGQVFVHKDGGLSLKTASGMNYRLRPDGTLAAYTFRGQTARFRPDGKVQHLHSGNTDISRGADNQRTIVTTRPDKSILVSFGPRHGYLQRTISRDGATYMQRTYVQGKRTYTCSYRYSTFQGSAYPIYTPRVYYAPAYYNWLIYPWNSPVTYNWNRGNDAWSEYYGGYFKPSPSYASASVWLADFVLAQTFMTAYSDMANTQAKPLAPPAATGPPMPQEVKDMIASDISRQLAQDKTLAANQLDPGNAEKPYNVISDGSRVFVVSAPLYATTRNSEECSLTAGDILKLIGPSRDGRPVADVSVVNSMQNDCASGSVVTLGLLDLQEMSNTMKNRTYEGLDNLRQQAGTNGFPGYSGPVDAEIQPANPTSRDNNVLAMLKNQQNEAENTEKQLLESVFAEDNQANDRASAM